MKRLFIVLFTLLSMACADKGGGGNSGTKATTPVDSRCITNSSLCNNSVYGQYSGWTPYRFPYGNTSYNYSTYFSTYGACGCPFGYQPAYNSSMGMGCFRTTNMMTFNLSWSFSFYASSGFYAPQTSLNIPQVSNIPNAGGGNCSRNVAISCLMNQANSCGVGATCREVRAGSGLGVCVTGPTDDGYYRGGYNGGGYPAPGGYGYGYGYGGYGYGASISGGIWIN
ncbi:MAG: hypothetical protein ACM3MG_13010 [Bacillota bacterium]